MKIRYTGNLSDGSVDVGGATYNFTKGEWIEVPDAVGEVLKSSPNWEIEGHSEAPRRRGRER